jgi:hypothetical protein
MKSGAYCCF